MASPLTAPIESRSVLQESMTSAMDSIRRASRTNSERKTRAHVGIFLAITTMFVIAMAFSLRAVYSHPWYRYDNSSFVVSLVFDIVFSLIMLAMLATVVRDFAINFIVGIIGMCIYIAIEFLANQYIDPIYLRVIATWSILTFWTVFAIDAVFMVGHNVTSWLANKLEDSSTGRIQLGSTDAVGVEYRDVPKVLAASDAAAVDLESGRADVSPKTGSAGN